MHSELAINLWAYCDYSTKLVYALSGRAYAVEGTDEEKLSVLQRLAATDYITAKRYELSDRFSVTYPDGTVLKKATQVHAVHDPNAHLFEEMFTNIESELPPIQKLTAAGSQETPQKLPTSPLIVATVVYEDEKGNLRPIVTTEDLAWLNTQIMMSNQL
jgi:hypothetical protein